MYNIAGRIECSKYDKTQIYILNQKQNLST